MVRSAALNRAESGSPVLVYVAASVRLLLVPAASVTVTALALVTYSGEEVELVIEAPARMSSTVPVTAVSTLTEPLFSVPLIS